MTQIRKKPRVTILCEDRQHYNFVRWFLQKRGFTEFAPRICPSGSKAGENYVRETYASEVKAYRSQKNHKNICLIAVIDADTGNVENRKRQLDSVLETTRRNEEKIAILVPKRNIETWIYYLESNEPIDEITRYPKLRNQEQGKCKSLVEKLAEQCVHGLPPDAPSSMHYACVEIQRIFG
ncbi:MAG: hypothetical protein WCP16_15680 [Pseudanabaena sp. ELA645]|jgi:hypothetical protein